MSVIFPNISFLKSQWTIPFWEEKEERIDTLAFHHLEGKWENFVLFEYKWSGGGERPLTQVSGYYKLLKKNAANYYVLRNEVLNDYLKENGQKEVEWKHNRNSMKNFWEKFILICVAPFGYYNSREIRDAREENGRGGIILVEVSKHENDSVLISLVEDRYRELLGMNCRNILIVPKKK